MGSGAVPTDRGGGQGPEAELRRGKKSVSRSVISDSLPLCGVGCQSPLSLGFSRQEYWSGLPFPSPMHACMLSHFSRVRPCVTPWTAAHQAPLSTGFSRQEYWSGLAIEEIRNSQF